jgi:hypothetical protein
MAAMVTRALGLALLLLAAGCAAEDPAVVEATPPHVCDVKVDGATIEIGIERGKLDLSEAEIQRWVESGARAVVAYYGTFPVSAASVSIHAVEGAGVSGGVAYGEGKPSVSVDLGAHTTRDQLDADWVMTHELIHLAFPSVDRSQHWVEEGISTYVEPLARRRLGKLTEERVWADLVEGLPQGEPQPGDEGLDRTTTWASTYWGGALFCFLADVEIHERTKNRFGLDDALAAIRAQGGVITASWDARRAFEAGDRAVGVAVLVPLYDKVRETPVTTDLAALWKRLGVEAHGDKVVFDDRAPLAAVRRSISRGP